MEKIKKITMIAQNGYRAKCLMDTETGSVYIECAKEEEMLARGFREEEEEDPK